MAIELRSGVKYGSFLSLAVVLVAYWFRSPDGSVLDERLDVLLSSLLRAERKVGMNGVSRPRVAIGTDFLSALNSMQQIIMIICTHGIDSASCQICHLYKNVALYVFIF